MKMKKIAAASLAVCVCALSGMSALAESVVTTTTYDYNQKAEESVEVVSVVSGVEAGTQVTYLVWGGNKDDIKYIDQKEATAGSATFKFTGAQGDIYSGSVEAKFGSNGTYTLPKNFKFNEGVNIINSGKATVSVIKGEADTDTFYGKVSGEVAEYGFAVKSDDSSYQLYPAAGAFVSDNQGIFGITIKGISADADVVAYAIDLSGNFSEFK